MSNRTTTLPESRGQMMPGNSSPQYNGQSNDLDDLEHKLKDLEYRLKYLEQHHPKGKSPYEPQPEDPNLPPELVAFGIPSVRDLVGPGRQPAQIGTEIAVTFIVVDVSLATFAETPVSGATVDFIVPIGVNAGVSATSGGVKGGSAKLTTNARGEATVYFQGNRAGRVKLTALTATTFRLISETAQIMVQ